jgi:putative tryptophan/tyrosine transport system substrate-binding protein
MKNRSISIRLALLPFVGACLLASGLVAGCSSSQSSRPVIVGVVNPTPIMEPVLEGFKVGMTELGYLEGQDIRYLYAGPSKNNLDDTLQGFLEQDVDLILAITTPAAQAAQAATTGKNVPVVFVPVTDPVGAGLVASLKEPGDNMTGIVTGGSDAQRLAWLLRVAPGARRIYLPYNPDDKSPVVALAQIQAAAAKLDVELMLRQANSTEQVQAAIANIPRDADAILIGPDSLVGSLYTDWVRAAIARKLPLTGSSTSHVEAGMLLSYSYDTVAVGHQAARLADQIFKGVEPAELPVETSEFFLSLNLKTAKAIGLDIPDPILRQAQRVFR